MTTAFYVTVTMVLGVAMLQISYCMVASAIWLNSSHSTTKRLQLQIAHGLIDLFCVILAMTTAFYVTVTMVLGVAMLQISYCMAARAIWQILALATIQ